MTYDKKWLAHFTNDLIEEGIAVYMEMGFGDERLTLSEHVKLEALVVAAERYLELKENILQSPEKYKDLLEIVK